MLAHASGSVEKSKYKERRIWLLDRGRNQSFGKEMPCAIVGKGYR